MTPFKIPGQRRRGWAASDPEVQQQLVRLLLQQLGPPRGPGGCSWPGRDLNIVQSSPRRGIGSFWREFARQDGAWRGKIITFVLPMISLQGLTYIFSSQGSCQEKNLSPAQTLSSYYTVIVGWLTGNYEQRSHLIGDSLLMRVRGWGSYHLSQKWATVLSLPKWSRIIQ